MEYQSGQWLGDKMKYTDEIILALERFPRIAGLLLGIAMHPVLAAIIGR